MPSPASLTETAPDVATLPPRERWLAPPQARLFLGVAIPPAAAALLGEAQHRFPQYIEKMVLPSHLHLTLIFLGEVENPQQYLSRLLKPMPQTYVPTVATTHVGRGFHRLQLWAYVTPSTILLNLREQLLDRLRFMRFPVPKTREDFVPHIHLANLYPMARGIGMADYSCSARFVVPEINLYESLAQPTGRVYARRASILLKP